MPTVRLEPRPIRLFRVALVAAALLAALLLVVVLGVGLGDRDSTDQGSRPPRKPGHVAWIISGEDLALLRHGNAGLARRYFDNRDTFVVGSAGDTQNLVPQGYRSIPTLSYTSLQALEGDIHFGRIDPRIAAVIYDPERWSKTPVAEQLAPVSAMRRFTRLAARWGYGPIVAPGRDLALGEGVGCAKRSGEYLDQAYLRCGLISGGRGAENFVIQAAPEELDLERMHQLLRGGRTQLRAQTPGALALASLSTVPPGADETAWPIDLVRAARLELRYVPGIMLNFTPQSTPLAASFLRDLEREAPINGLLVSRRD